jgi:hypothetical protein
LLVATYTLRKTYSGEIVWVLEKNDEWNNRLTILENEINYWIQNTTNKTVEITMQRMACISISCWFLLKLNRFII